jgi:hypothetical protein
MDHTGIPGQGAGCGPGVRPTFETRAALCFSLPSSRRRGAVRSELGSGGAGKLTKACPTSDEPLTLSAMYNWHTGSGQFKIDRV